MKKKRFLALAVFLLTVFGAQAVIATENDSGKWGNLTWTVKGEELILSGNGPMKDSDALLHAHNPWSDNYDDRIKKVTIQNGVTSIGKNSFLALDITKVTIPNSVKSIGEHAFGYTKLKRITIPTSVKSIGKSAFVQSELEEITIPKSVKSIGDFAFAQCCNLKKVTIEGDVPNLGEGIFSECCNLTQVTLMEGIKTIGFSEFGQTGLKKVIIPNSVEEIDYYAFSNCINLESVKLGNSVKIIRPCAFQSCDNLKEINIPDSVIELDNCAIISPKLKSIRIPKSVKKIGEIAIGYYEKIGKNIIHLYKTPGFTIYGYRNTKAEEYALEKGFEFVALDNKSSPKTNIKTTPRIKGISAGKKKVSVSWRRISKKDLSKVEYIQVQYSTNKKFRKALFKLVEKEKTKIKLNLLGKRLYYFRIRYVGKNGVSKWSKVKKVKTKK